MRLAVIPARGGSKRVPGKNVRMFAGRPMIAWSIQAAQDSGCFDRIVVSTDDEAIAEIATVEGAETPFRRPADLADDHTPTVPVVAHAIAQEGEAVTQVCCLYATAPFVRAEDIRAGLTALEADDLDYVFPVTTFDFPIQRAVRLDAAGRVSMLQPEHLNTRSQDLEEALHDAGQFYWGTREAWLDGRPIFGARSAALRIPRSRVQDIDTVEDWERAELMFAALAGREGKGAS